MQKVCITPIDDSSALRVSSLKLWVECRSKGITTRRLFVEKMTEEFPKYKKYEGLRKLESFWVNRLFEESLNIDVEKMISKLPLD